MVQRQRLLAYTQKTMVRVHPGSLDERANARAGRDPGLPERLLPHSESLASPELGEMPFAIVRSRVDSGGLPLLLRSRKRRLKKVETEAVKTWPRSAVYFLLSPLPSLRLKTFGSVGNWQTTLA